LDVIYKPKVAKWDVFEVELKGKTEGNPFTDYDIKGCFNGKNEHIYADGFYDGDGVYKVRFMPSYEGEYTFLITGSFSENGTDDIKGEFVVSAARKSNHGPVGVVNKYHFSYEDGTKYYSIGTTCYVWELQSDELIAQTLESLSEAGFNKIRFCIFPKHYDYNLKEPRSYPYEGAPIDSSVLTSDNFNDYTASLGNLKKGNDWDFTRFNPEHFAHIETCIYELGKRGIEADLIVMHPYDRWGFSQMTKEQDDLYWNYVIARFSAFHNVWWSLANEYDLLPGKSIDDWERYADIICEKDPYHHLRSIHNCFGFYDHTRSWITHCSIQRQELYRSSELVNEWRTQFGKPVVLDEIAYEGNIQHGWGNISGEEMLRRFWEAALRGGYPGHSECFMSDDNILWWSHGGKLKGESWKRFQFLHDIMLETPGYGLMPYEKCGWDEICGVPEEQKEEPLKDYYLFYYSFMRPSFRTFYFDDKNEYEVEVIDSWNMTIEPKGRYKGKFNITLPGRAFMAIRVKRAMV